MKTINGLTLEEVLKKCAEDFPQEAIQNRSYDNVPYISADTFKTRLNEVVGKPHYRDWYDEVRIVHVNDTWTAVTNGHFEFLDDNYEPIYHTDYPGGCDIKFPKVDLIVDGKPVLDEKGEVKKVPGTVSENVPNCLDSACKDAFKRICKNHLNMGVAQLDKAKKGATFTTTINEIKEYKDNLFGEIEYNGKKIRLAVFKNAVPSFKKYCGNAIPKKGDVITFFGKEGKDNKGNDQLIFNKPSSVPFKSAAEVSANVGNSNTTGNATNTNANGNANTQKNNTSSETKEETLFLMSKDGTKVKERSTHPGDYSMQCTNADKTKVYNVVIQKGTIDKLGTMWNKFVDKVNEGTKNIEFKGTFIKAMEGNTEVYQFQKFAS